MTLTTLIIGLVAIALALSLVMSLSWVIERATGNSGWIDTVWTFGLGVVGAAAALLPAGSSTSTPARQLLVAAAIAVWSLRLGIHIAQRSASRGDDPRYAMLRESYGNGAAFQMWLLVQKQAIVSIPLVLAIWLAAHHPFPSLRWQDVLGVLIVVVAIGGEALADHQLRQCHRNGGRAICEIGLWRWSRHPNYFFEWFGWLAWPVIAINFTGTYTVGWLALGAPICMYWLLRYVSGVPPLEEHMLKTRGDVYRSYQRRVSAFVPWPPAKVTP